MAQPWAAREVAGAQLPDDRFRPNVARIAEGLASNGGSSFSVACGHGGRQAARRLFRNEETTVAGLLQGHVEQTAVRCSAAGHDLVLCIQDTTTLDYTRHRSKTGLGPISYDSSSRGLLAHSVLAVAPDGVPLGVLHLDIWSRDAIRPVGEREAGEEPNKRTRRKRDTSEKESGKWLRGLRAVQQALPPSQTVLMVQDREADVFDLFAEPRRSRTHLLVRMAQGRRRVEAECRDEAVCNSVLSTIEGTPVAGEMVVEVGRKPNQPAREARLTVQFSSMRLLPPRNPQTSASRARQAQPITVIRAAEVDAPDGVEPICWILLSTMPVSTVEEARRIVGYYALRWMIERLHFTLKSGCSNVERVQIDDGHALKNALAIYYMVAWRVLHLTHLARTKPDEPADLVLSPLEQQVLRAASKRPVATVADALTEIARLAGHEHYAKAPPPGVKRVWQGLRILETLTQGWILAQLGHKM